MAIQMIKEYFRIIIKTKKFANGVGRSWGPKQSKDAKSV